MLALFLPSIYKFLGVVIAVLVMGFLLWWSTRLQMRREAMQKDDDVLALPTEPAHTRGECD
jgi:hypothetical protein